MEARRVEAYYAFVGEAPYFENVCLAMEVLSASIYSITKVNTGSYLRNNEILDFWI